MKPFYNVGIDCHILLPTISYLSFGKSIYDDDSYVRYCLDIESYMFSFYAIINDKKTEFCFYLPKKNINDSFLKFQSEQGIHNKREYVKKCGYDEYLKLVKAKEKYELSKLQYPIICKYRGES